MPLKIDFLLVRLIMKKYPPKLIQITFSTDLRCKIGGFVLLIQMVSIVWCGKWCTIVVCGMEPSKKRRQPQQPLKTNNTVVKSNSTCIQLCIKIKK